jgi:hypothetical protein
MIPEGDLPSKEKYRGRSQPDKLTWQQTPSTRGICSPGQFIPLKKSTWSPIEEPHALQYVSLTITTLF